MGQRKGLRYIKRGGKESCVKGRRDVFSFILLKLQQT